MNKICLLFLCLLVMSSPCWGKRKSTSNSSAPEARVVDCFITIPRAHYNIIESHFGNRYYNYLKILKVDDSSPDGLYQLVLYQKEASRVCRITYRIKISNNRLVQCEEQSAIVLGEASRGGTSRSVGCFSTRGLMRMF